MHPGTYARTVRAGACAALARIADGSAAVGLVLLAIDAAGDPGSGLHRGALAGGMLAALLSVPHVLGPVVAHALDRTARPGAVLAAFFTAYAAALATAALTIGRLPLAVPLLAAATAGTCGPLLTGGLSSRLAEWMSPGPGSGEAAAADGRATARPRRGMAGRVEALDSATYGVGGILGPAAVTAGAAAGGARAAVLAVAGCALVAAVLALTLPPVAAPASHGGASMPLRDVLRAMWRSVPLRRTTIGTCLSEGAAGGLPVAAALLAVRLGHPSRDVGVLMTAFGLGALAGPIALAALPRLRGEPLRRLPVYATVIAVAYAAAAVAPGFPAAAACFAVAGLADGPLLAATLAVRSRYAPPAARARIFVTGAGLKIGAASLGAALTGVAADLGARTLFLLCAAVAATGAATLLGGLRDTP